MDHSVSSGGGESGYETIVLGAGPAGLQMGQHLSRAGRSYVILEAGDSPGTSFKKLPRHRTPISSDKAHTGLGDPEVNLRFDGCSLLDDGDGRLRFKDYCRKSFPPAGEMVRYLCDYARYFELDVRCDTRIVRVERPRADGFRLTDAGGSAFHCRRLIAATGVARGEAEDLACDEELACAGCRFDDSIFAPECRPQLVLDGRFPAQTPEWESVNVPGLYFAGALMQANDFEKAASGFVHGFRYNVRALHRMLEKKHHQRSWPARRVEPTPEGLVEAALARLNRSSALWHQAGFLHDVIVVGEGWENAVHCEEMPLAYIQESEIGGESHYYTLALEPGKVEGDPSRIARDPQTGMAERGVSLHPAIRRWCGCQRIAELHLPEDLLGEWRKPEAHVALLRDFFMRQLLESVDFEKVYRNGSMPATVQLSPPSATGSPALRPSSSLASSDS